MTTTSPITDGEFPQHATTVHPPSLPTIVVPPSPGRKGHRTRGSITNGIGLWEHDSFAASTSVLGDGGPGDFEEEEPVAPEEVEEVLEALNPTVRVRLGGWGEIAALAVVEGTSFGKEEGGKVLVALRRSGCVADWFFLEGDGGRKLTFWWFCRHLSLHSLFDGREFGNCDAGVNVPVAARNSLIAFDGMQVLALEDVSDGTRPLPGPF